MRFRDEGCLLSHPWIFCPPFSACRGVGKGFHVKACGIGRCHGVGGGREELQETTMGSSQRGCRLVTGGGRYGVVAL